MCYIDPEALARILSSPAKQVCLAARNASQAEFGENETAVEVILACCHDYVSASA